MAEAVKVAVRVRPFNQREIDYKTSLVIDMQGILYILKEKQYLDDLVQFEE